MSSQNSNSLKCQRSAALFSHRTGKIKYSSLPVTKRWVGVASSWIDANLFILFFLLWPVPGWAGYVQLDAVADIKTRFSVGCSTVQELANLARHRGIDVIIYSDSDRRSLEYGIVPFEGIFKKKRTHPSILTSGAASYLAEINNNDKKFDDVLLIPAVESAPFYYWSGNLSEKNLTANNWDKHLLILGLDRPEDYEQLPILNSNFSKKYLDLFLKPFLIYAGIFLVFFIFYLKGWARKTTFFLMIMSGLLAVDNLPFKSSRFDAYHGDPGIGPYQEVINYARSKNAMVFWNHLESAKEVGKEGAMDFKTLPHPEDLILSKGFTGFQAVYDEKGQATKPGEQWDQVLMDYVSGNRKQAAWGYGGNDFHCEGDNGHVFGGVRTVLLVREKNREAVMEAFKLGRMYSVKQTGDYRLSLDNFSIADKASQQEATLGESLLATYYPEIKIKIRSTEGAEKPISLSIIRNGQLIKEEKATLPYELNWRDIKVKRKGRAYYRMMAQVDDGNYLVSNPVFVSFTKSGKEVAALAPKTREPVMDPKRPQVQPPVPPVSPQTPVEPEVKMKEVKPAPKTLDVKPKNKLPTSPVEKKLDTGGGSKSAQPAEEFKSEDSKASMNIPKPNKISPPEKDVIPMPILPKVEEPVAPVKPKVELTSPKTTYSPALKDSRGIEAQSAVKKNGRVFLIGRDQVVEPVPASEAKEAAIKLEPIVQVTLAKKTTAPETVKASEPQTPVVGELAVPTELKVESTSPKPIALSKKIRRPETLKPKTSPKAESKPRLLDKHYVVALIDGVTLKKGPGVEFPEIATAKKGERLEFVRALSSTFNNKPWLEVQRKGRTVYVWGGLVRPE